MQKSEIKKEIEKQFFNGSYVEIHTGDLDEILDIILSLINKPVETTNECPNSEQIDNALDVLYGDNSCNHSNVISYLNSLT